MDASGNSKCSSSEFYQNHYGECNDGTSLSRRLDEDEEDTETLVPVVDGVADLSKTAPQFQAAISSARLSFNATSEERRLGDTRQWSSCHSFMLSRRSMNWYWCMKCEFVFRGWAFLLKISWGVIKSQMALSLVCQACLPLEKLWSIPPPLCAKFCVTGTLHVWVAHGCPGIWICFYGRWRSVSLSADTFSVGLLNSESKLAATITRFRPTAGGCVAKAAADGDGGHAGAELRGIATTAMSASSTSRAGFLLLTGSLNSSLSSGTGSDQKNLTASFSSTSSPFGKHFGQNGTEFTKPQSSGTTCEKASVFFFYNNHPCFRWHISCQGGFL